MGAERGLYTSPVARLERTRSLLDRLAAACRTSSASRLATLAILVAAYALVGWLWLLSDLAWFHVELFAVSEYVWSGPRLASLGAQLRALFDWHVFDVSPYRLRTASDLVEIVDAITRPALRGVFGLHPSATLAGIGLAAAVPAFFYKAMRRFGLANVQAALFVLLLVSTIGFLSCFVPYLRPAKKLALLGCCLVPYLCLLLQRRASRKLYAALFAVLFVGFLADETGYALLPVSLVLLARPMVRRRGWGELAGFIALLLAFLVAARYVLPYVYGSLGQSGPRDKALAGHVVFGLLDYLATPGFYSFALDDLGRSVLSSFGVIEVSGAVVVGFLILFFATAAAWAGLYFRSEGKNAVIYWDALAFSVALAVFSFSLSLFDWFDNPFASNYMGTLTFYYHSAIAVMAVFWAASVCRAILASPAALRRGSLASGVLAAALAIVVGVNIGNFRILDRLFEIIHTYPLEARSLDGTAWAPLEHLALDDAARSGRITVIAPRAVLDVEYEELLRRSIGPHTANFEKALSIYRAAPIGGAQYVERYVRLFYPGYDIRATVMDPGK